MVADYYGARDGALRGNARRAAYSRGNPHSPETPVTCESSTPELHVNFDVGILIDQFEPLLIETGDGRELFERQSRRNCHGLSLPETRTATGSAF